MLNFKRKYRIVSRKTTKLVAGFSQADEEELEQEASNFRSRFTQLLQSGIYGKVFNADQVGLVLEFSSSRTLRRCGCKDVFLSIRSKFNTTHSIAIMPTIDISGQLIPPLFVCLREPSGEFGPHVARSLFTDPLLHVTSKSGKMNAALFKQISLT